mmetsp:Transcript_17212/g.21204  ORF Transcript_17212/g.21204 Transcript_17212/m.21204 type:complete len:105 (+) Transcript_17212:626-940(+)
MNEEQTRLLESGYYIPMLRWNPNDKILQNNEQTPNTAPSTVNDKVDTYGSNNEDKSTTGVFKEPYNNNDNEASLSDAKDDSDMATEDLMDPQYVDYAEIVGENK